MEKTRQMKNNEISREIFELIFQGKEVNQMYHHLATEKDVHTIYDCIEGDVLIFDSKEDYENGCCEAFLICKIENPKTPKHKGKFIFLTRVQDAGVYMRRDGTGEPPSVEMVEGKEIYPSFQLCLIGLVKEIIQYKCADLLMELDFLSAKTSASIEEFQHSAIDQFKKQGTRALIFSAAQSKKG